MVFLRPCCIQLNPLHNVVAVLILHQFLKVNSGILEELVVESDLLVHINFEAKTLLDKPGTFLVDGAFKSMVLNDLKSE